MRLWVVGLALIACAQALRVGASPLRQLVPTRTRSASALQLRGGAAGPPVQLDTAPPSSVFSSTVAAAPTVVPTKPFDGQKPGTSGLRKKTKVFQQPHYLENFVQVRRRRRTHAPVRSLAAPPLSAQSIFDSLDPAGLVGSTLVVSGDGRYHNEAAIQTICRMAAANGVARVWVGVGGLLSTPAASAIIREREGGVAFGGIILTASHNPGGPDADFGIKYNVENGGPALEAFTDAVHARSGRLSSYKICASLPDIDLSAPGRHLFTDEGTNEPTERFFEVEVIDPTADYVALLRRVFDLGAIRAFLGREDMSLAIDGMHGVAGPYARALFVDELGLDPSCLSNCLPSPNFGDGHPDPNLVYAASLVESMGLSPNGVATEAAAYAPVLGAAADGDADRNMILGRGFFVTPSDSLALIAAHAHLIPGFRDGGGIRAVARSMPTSGALDRVAEALGLPLFETPTGWKFFGNLMDSEALGGHFCHHLCHHLCHRLCHHLCHHFCHNFCHHLMDSQALGGEQLAPLLCGEESFGTGSSHVREKDGLWAVLAWLTILADRNLHTPSGELVGVGEIVRHHWERYGRNYYTRYDYEAVDAEKAAAMVEHLLARRDEFRAAGHGKANPQPVGPAGYALAMVDEFEYTDPIDGSISSRQGIRLLFSDGSRVIVRLSGTGSVGATVRLYIEKYQPPGEAALLLLPMADALAPLVELALEITQVRELTGRAEPTVIT